MPIIIEEFVEIVDVEGKHHEGKAIASNLVAIKDSEENVVYGQVLKGMGVKTKVSCDNEKCVNSTVGDDFKTSPKSVEFVNDGDGSPEFVKTVAQIVIVANYRNEKMVFCSPECSAAYFRRVTREEKPVEETSHGKGTKTQFEEERSV